MNRRKDTSVFQTDRTSPAIVGQRPASPAVWWVIAVSLAVIALCLVLRLDSMPNGQAFAQSVGKAGARGIFAFTGQLTKNSYGVFMVDVDAGTIWCYEYQGRDNKSLKLVAARDWRYDRYLENHCTDPPVNVIKQMLEDQRAAKLQAAGP